MKALESITNAILSLRYHGLDRIFSFKILDFLTYFSPFFGGLLSRLEIFLNVRIAKCCTYTARQPQNIPTVPRRITKPSFQYIFYLYWCCLYIYCRYDRINLLFVKCFIFKWDSEITTWHRYFRPIKYHVKSLSPLPKELEINSLPHPPPQGKNSSKN